MENDLVDPLDKIQARSFVSKKIAVPRRRLRRFHAFVRTSGIYFRTVYVKCESYLDNDNLAVKFGQVEFPDFICAILAEILHGVFGFCFRRNPRTAGESLASKIRLVMWW